MSNAAYCKCGKVYSATESEAVRRYKLEEAWHGRKTPRVRFYECDFGSWHWTRKLRPNDPVKCPTCPEEAYPHLVYAFDALESAPKAKRIKFVPFACDSGLWHLEVVSTRAGWSDYQCECGRTDYHFEEHKTRILTSMRDNWGLTDYDLVRCKHDNTHITKTKGKN